MTQTITVPEALLFAGKTFAKLGTDGPQGIHGYYERGRNGNVKLYKLDSTLEACIIDNHRQGHFVVSALHVFHIDVDRQMARHGRMGHAI